MSQGHDHICLRFPKFLGSHLKGDHTGPLTNESFLHMHEFGPFRIHDSSEMMKVASFIRGYTLRVDKDDFWKT